MIQEFGAEHVFDNHFEPCEPAEKDYVLHFRDGKCLARVTHVGAEDADAGDSGEVVELPRLGDYPSTPERLTYLFSLGEERFFLAFDEDLPLPTGFAYESVNWLRRAEPQHLLFAAATAAQLSRWYQDNRFCGRCGHATELAPGSREIVCPECARIVYPKICPGIICAVVRLADDPADDAIVLTRYAGRTTALWALVAGFTEIGEPLEDTVRREVMEEVGLSVKNLRFYKSQPWGFTDTLMVGFWCEVDGDPAITVDHTELKEARWFRRSEMPLERTNDRASLTGEMIERFRTMGRAAWEWGVAALGLRLVLPAALVDLSDDSTWVANGKGVGWHILGDHAARPDDRAGSDAHPGQHDDATPEPTAVTDGDGQSIGATEVLARCGVPVWGEALVELDGMRRGIELNV